MENKKTNNDYYNEHFSQNLTRVVTFMITITSLPETLKVLIIHFPSQHWLLLEDVLEVDMYGVSRGDLVRQFSR